MGLYGNKKHFMSSFTNKTELKIAKFLEWVWSKHWISYHEPSSKRKLDLKPETSFSHSHLYPFCFVPSALLDLTWQRNPISNHLNNRKSMSEISHANILNPYRSSCRMTQHKFYFLNKISQRESYIWSFYCILFMSIIVLQDFISKCCELNLSFFFLLTVKLWESCIFCFFGPAKSSQARRWKVYVNSKGSMPIGYTSCERMLWIGQKCVWMKLLEGPPDKIWSVRCAARSMLSEGS